MKSIKSVNMGDTGNGPCIEVYFDDNTYLLISDIDGCGLPSRKSWCVGHYDDRQDCKNVWASTDKKYLWRDMERHAGMNAKECRALILASMITWGCESFNEGCSAEETWRLMMEVMEYDLSLLTLNDIDHVQATIKHIITS